MHRPGYVPVTPRKLYLLAFALFAFMAALNISLVRDMTEEKCDTRQGAFSSGFRAFGPGGTVVIQFDKDLLHDATLLPVLSIAYSAKGDWWRKSTAEKRIYPGTYFKPKSEMKLSVVVFG